MPIERVGPMDLTVLGFVRESVRQVFTTVDITLSARLAAMFVGIGTTRLP